MERIFFLNPAGDKTNCRNRELKIFGQKNSNFKNKNKLLVMNLDFVLKDWRGAKSKID